jgi:hypothetical protein
MFVQALEAISKKIAKSKQKDQGYKILESKIMNSPVLKAQFEIFTDLRENAQKISSRTEYTSFYKTLTEKVNKIDASKLKKEITSLLEYFNINPRKMAITTMDNAMSLNENAVKRVVIDQDKKMIQEHYKSIIKKNNDIELMKEFQILGIFARGVRADKKKFIDASIEALKEEKYIDYSSCVKKLYKLRILTEALLEAEKNKTFSIPELNHIASEKSFGRVSVDEGEVTSVFLKLWIPVYYNGTQTKHTWTAAGKTIGAFEKMETTFVNQFIIKSGRKKMFIPSSINWKVIGREQARIGVPNIIRIEVIIPTNPGVSDIKAVVAEANSIVTEFDNSLPSLLGDMKDVLSPDNLGSEGGHVDRKLINKRIAGLEPGNKRYAAKKSQDKAKKGMFGYDGDEYGGMY